MTYEEAIKMLSRLAQIRSDGYYDYLANGGKADDCFDNEMMAFDKAIEALEKQNAKKPQEKYEYMGNIGRGLNPMEYIKGYVCPTCGEWLDEFAHHCICGQAIDWSDDE